MRAAIYARVSTTNHGQDPTFRRESYGNTVCAGGGRSRTSTWTRVSLARKSAGHNSTAC